MSKTKNQKKTRNQKHRDEAARRRKAYKGNSCRVQAETTQPDDGLFMEKMCELVGFEEGWCVRLPTALY